ncbi:MAG TPA: WXG100 family type VII secretion target [Ktedonobacteraceae bacterium]|jgi:uncharacterized protein YukE|nr:WXG100 family type VII secretion target [Ktedonobacteraceae bacterium]
MADIGKLEYIAGELRSKAGKFTGAAETLRQQATQLNWAASNLANGSWSGQGSQAFQNAWNLYHYQSILEFFTPFSMAYKDLTH